MKNIVYANMSYASMDYVQIDFFIELKRKVPNIDMLYLCIWDKRIFEDKGFYESLLANETSEEKLKKMVEKVEQLLISLDIKNYELIYLSDAIERLSSDKNITEIVERTTSKINLGDLERMYKKISYIRPVPISRIIYLIYDFLICLYLNEIYPTFKYEPNIYYAGDRSKPLNSFVSDVLTEKKKPVREIKKVYYLAPKALINEKDRVNWPYLKMDSEIVKKSIYQYFEKQTEIKKKAEELLRLFAKVTKDITLYKKKKIEKIPLEKAIYLLDSLKKDDISETIYLNMMEYFNLIDKKMEKISIKKTKNIIFIKDAENFDKIFSILNPAKIEIIKLCDGTRSISQIAQNCKLKDNSVRCYISELRKNRIISNEKNPNKVINEIVIML